MRLFPIDQRIRMHTSMEHCNACSNVQNIYCIVNYKGFRITKCKKQSKKKTYSLNFAKTKNKNKTKSVRQTATNNIH